MNHTTCIKASQSPARMTLMSQQQHATSTDTPEPSWQANGQLPLSSDNWGRSTAGGAELVPDALATPSTTAAHAMFAQAALLDSLHHVASLTPVTHGVNVSTMP